MDSLQDKISAKTALIQRALLDNAIRVTGRSVEVVRFKIQEDMYEDERRTTLSTGTITARIVYPPGGVPLYRATRDSLTQKPDDSGLFLFDVLPIELYARWTDNVEKGDIIFHSIQDESGAYMGMLLRISECIVKFSNSLIWRKFLCAPFSGQLDPELSDYLEENFNW